MRRLRFRKEYLPPLYRLAAPAAVELSPEVFELPYVRRAKSPAPAASSNARSEARFFAMLANGGELDGVRLLPEDLVATFQHPQSQRRRTGYGHVRHANADHHRRVLVRRRPSSGAPDAKSACLRVIPAPAVQSDGPIPMWNLAVAICHNRMFVPQTVAEDPILPIANAVRQALGLPH